MKNRMKLPKRLLAYVVALALVSAAAAAGAVAAPREATALLTPEIITIGPNNGPVTGGDVVTITGRYFNEVSTGVDGYTGVYFDNVPAQVLTKTDIAMTVVAPRHVAGPVDVKLTTSVLDVIETAGYTYTEPSITSVTPSVGPTAGGTKITIKGSGFGFPSGGIYGSSGTPMVTIGGAPATSVVRVDENTLTAISPARTAGVRDVVVSVPHSAGSPIVITRPAGYNYVLAPVAPVITSISPAKGPVGGGQPVMISGRNLVGSDTNPAVIRIGSTVLSVTSVNPDGTTMLAVTPPGTIGKFDVSATTSDGRSTLLQGYEYGPPPSISNVSPASGPTMGARQITITGTGFGTAGTPVVTVGGVKALCVSRESDTVIRAVTPPLTAGVRNVVVTPDTGGGIATARDAYAYVTPTSASSVSSVTPARGVSTGGTPITITGSGFDGGGTPTVLVGSDCATDVTVVSPTEITAVTPRGPIGLTSVRITTATGTAVKADGYDYLGVLRILPATGQTTGGEAVQIQGQGFGFSGTPSVTFGGVAATNVVRVSDTLLTATAPPNSVGAKTVVVTPAAPLPQLTLPSGYTYKPPTITTVSPGAGVVTGGTPITIIGTGFGDSGTPTVTVGGAAATSVNRVSSTEIRAMTPAGVLGFADVVVTPALGTGSATKTNGFEYVIALLTPLIDDVSPTRGPTTGGGTLTVSGENFRGTDLAAATITIGGVVISNPVVSADGTQVTFTLPALGAGYQTLVVGTNEGAVVYRYAFQAVVPPSIGGGGGGSCSGVSPTTVVYTGDDLVTVTGSGFKEDGNPANPTVTVSGIAAEVTASTNTSVQFKVPNVQSGPQTIVITSTTGGGPVTVTGCLTVRRGVTIAAVDKSILFGEPTPVFTFSTSGLISPDSVSDVTYTFTGTGGVSYGPSTTPPTAAGVYLITPSAAVFSTGDPAKYEITYVNGTYTIAGLPATVTADDQSITYGDPAPTFTSVATGLAGGHSLSSVTYTFTGTGSTSYGPSTTVPTDAGTYSITPSSAVLSPSGVVDNYSITYVAGVYTISPKPITVAADDQSKTYGDDDPTLTYTATGLVGSDSLAGGLSRNSGENVGDYTITQGTVTNANNPNYDITYVSGTLTINKKPITVTADDQSKEYGDDDPTLTYTSDGLVGDDTLPGSLTRVSGEEVGDYSIDQGSLEGGSNYEIVLFNSGTLTITTRAITIIIEDVTITYGDPTPTFTPVLDSGTLAFDDALESVTTSGEGTDAGEYEITPSAAVMSPGSTSNYTITYLNGTLTVLPKPLTVTADDKSKTYGEDDPELTYVASGLIGNDTISGSLDRDTGEDAGQYSINVGTLSAGSNYEIQYTSGTLTIDPKPITVTADDQTKTYGDSDPEFTYVAEGLVGSDTLSGSPGRDPGENVGDYTIDVGTLAGNSNYDITFVSGTLTIDPKDISVTADDKSKEYGDSDPELTYSSDGLVGGDTLDGALERDPGEDIGDYPINQGTLDGGSNYNIISFTPGTLTITTRAITIKADDQTITYGDSLPTNGVTVTAGSLAGSDEIDSASYAYTPSTPVDVGDYPITPSSVVFSVGSASNYSIIYADGTLTIEPATVYVVADDESKTYGDSDPVLTYSSTGLIGSDTLSGDIERDSGENAGDYDIVVGTLSAGPNYLIDYTGATFTIDRRSVTVTADPQSKTYGDSDPEFTYVAVGLFGDDTLSGTLDRDSGTDVGDYPITQGSVDNASNPNYDISFTGSTLTIDPKDISVTADDKSKEYGDSDPELTYSSDGLVGGDTLEGALERDPGEDVGDYPINQGTLDGGSNYNIISFTPGTLTITKRFITVEANDQTITVGDPLPENGVTVVAGSLLDGDELGTADYAYSPGSPAAVGSYAIIPSNLTINSGSGQTSAGEGVRATETGNYEVTYENGTLTINKRAITITVGSTTVFSGDTPEFSYTIEGLPEGAVPPELVVFVVGETGIPVAPGVYELDVDAGGLTDEYDVIIVRGALTVLAAEVLGLLPISGVYLGGTPFTITGLGFGPPGSTVTVTFGGRLAVDVQVVNSTTITGFTPAWDLEDPDLPETVDVEVIVLLGGGGFLAQAYTYLPIIPPPVMTSLSPPQGPTSGGTRLSITGANFFGKDGLPATVFVNGVAAVEVEVDPTGEFLLATTPPGPEGEPRDVEVYTSDGATTFLSAFTYIPPSISGITPNFGPTTGGTQVTITGSNFGPSPGRILFGGVEATIVSWSDTEIVVITSPREAGFVDVTIETSGGGTFTLEAAFEYRGDETLPVTGSDPWHLVGLAIVLIGFGALAQSAVLYVRRQRLR